MSGQILQTTANLPVEDFTFEPKGARDGEGAPTYGTAVSFEANVMERDTEFVVAPDGSKIATPLVLYIPGDAANVPGLEDRVNRLSGNGVYIVRGRSVVAGLAYTTSEPDHFKLKLSREGDE